jgi:hypothetical protein
VSICKQQDTERKKDPTTQEKKQMQREKQRETERFDEDPLI